jgi:PAS domain S-box-containing protein
VPQFGAELAFSIQPCYTEPGLQWKDEEGRLSERSRGTELAALTTIAAQVNCTQDLDEILSAALVTTLEVVGECSGEIFLLDEETDELVLRTHQGLSDAFVAEEGRIDSNECLCGQAVRELSPLVLSDLADHPARTRTACLREGFHACIRLPLLARGQMLGLLNVQSRSYREFSTDDVELLQAIGNQIGIAIANARLIKDAEQRRATLDSVMNSLVDGLVLINRRNIISYVNPHARAMLGLPASEIVGSTVRAVEVKIRGRIAEPERVVAELEGAAVNAQNPSTVEFSLTEPVARTIQARFFPIHDGGGGHLGLGLLLRDVTREKELDQMKARLLSTVSHELRTPLASIKGFATTLLRQDVDWDDTSRHEFLSIIDEESDRLTELIGNLLDMSRIEAGELRVEPEPMELGPIVRETAGEFQVLTHDHRFVVDEAPVLPAILADPRRIRQVLRNLVENAVKYSPSGGTITLSTRVQVDRVQVTVTDEGLGIEKKDLERIFDRFYQVDGASTRRVGGSGLGLSICQAIVRAHEGQIWVESRPGQGSSFHFTLPLAAPASSRASTMRTGERPAGS